MLSAASCEQFKCDVAPHAETLPWRTYGPDGAGPPRVKLLGDLETSHLENILITCSGVSTLYRTAIVLLLRERYRH